MEFDLHIHSNYSYDSLMKPKQIVKVSKKRGLDGIAITDHGTILGGEKAFRDNKDQNFQVIIGSEINTEYGEIIGLFLNEEIKQEELNVILDEIHDQDGISILVHPYRNHRLVNELVTKVDAIEVFNARSKKWENEMASILANKFNKPKVAGSDSHTIFEIGRGKTVIDSLTKDSLLSGKSKTEGEESNYYLVHGLSFVIETIHRMTK